MYFRLPKCNEIISEFQFHLFPLQIYHWIHSHVLLKLRHLPLHGVHWYSSGSCNQVYSVVHPSNTHSAVKHNLVQVVFFKVHSVPTSLRSQCLSGPL